MLIELKFHLYCIIDPTLKGESISNQFFSLSKKKKNNEKAS